MRARGARRLVVVVGKEEGGSTVVVERRPNSVVQLETTWQFGMIGTRVLLFVHPTHPRIHRAKESTHSATSGPPRVA